MISNHAPPILLTGATGFLGHFVLRDLLARGQRIVAVLRSPLDDSTNRLKALMAQVGVNLSDHLSSGQLTLVEGSMPDHLPEPEWGPTDAVLNCAASLQLFSNGNDDPFKTNVAGTEAIIAWANRHNVKRIHAVSTAYTCGWNSGVIREDFHRTPPEFQTDYEKSKWQAESLFEQWSGESGRKLTIFRPSFLVGDSQTGYTTQFAGFYQFARLVSVLKNQYHDPNNGAKTYIPLRIPGRPDDPQNIVPVDFVAGIIAEVVKKPAFHGRIYHLTNPEPPTNDLMKRCYEDYFGLHGGYFADPDEVIGECSTPESLLWDEYHVLTSRVVNTPLFDASNTREVMKASGMSFPVLNRDRIFMLFDYAAACGWGRRTNGFHS